MTKNLITRYLEHKKKCLTSYALSLFIDTEYKNFEVECLKKYINNYVEVFYHGQFETLGDGVIPDRNAIEIEQEGMRLELLDELQVREIIEKFEQIFSDTLDETEININGFTISAPDESTSEFEDILMFKTIEDLQAYMQDKQNPLPEDDEEREMFDAYSQYIDAVITHIGLI